MIDDNQNMVIILGRFQTRMISRERPLDKVQLTDIMPVYSVAVANADVVIIKDGKKFAVLKHRHMTGVLRSEYHASTLNNIISARS